MSDKRTHAEYQARRELEACGWRVRKRDSVAFNAGSETVKHTVAKTLAAYVAKQHGYRVDSEVEMDGGEVDILAYGKPGEPPFVVELETSPTEDTVGDKINRYVHDEPVYDLFLVNLNNLPLEMIEARDHIETVLFGDT